MACQWNGRVFFFPAKEKNMEKTVRSTIEQGYAFVNDWGACQLIVDSFRIKTGNAKNVSGRPTIP